MLTKEYFESEGIRLMELDEDEQAKAFLAQAAYLGSEKAKVCLYYLNMNVCDADFLDKDHNAHSQEPFDYDLQPLRHVSYAGAVLQKSVQNVRNRVEYLADDFASKCALMIRRMSGGIAV